MRRRHPDAHITAIVPIRAGLSAADMPDANEILALELSPLRLLLFGLFFNTVRQLRIQNFELFILRVGTLKLRLLATLARPLRCELWQTGGIIAAVNTSNITAATKEYFHFRAGARRTIREALLNAYFKLICVKERDGE